MLKRLELMLWIGFLMFLEEAQITHKLPGIHSIGSGTWPEESTENRLVINSCVLVRMV